MKFNKDLRWNDEKYCLEQVKRNGYFIQFIQDPSEAVQIQAIQQDTDAIQFIQDPSENVQ